MTRTTRITRIGSAWCAAWLALQTGCAWAAEGQNVRLLGGTVGRELFAPTVPGHYGTVNLIHYDTSRLKNNDGDTFSTSQTVPLASGPVVVPVAVRFQQKQTTLLLRYVWVSEAELAGARLGFTAALPLIAKDRELTLTPDFPSTLPQGARNNVIAGLQAEEARNNGNTSGAGDLEVGASLSWEGQASKVVFAPTVILPTGRYEASQALNAGQGNYITFRPALSWGWLPRQDLQVGARLLWGINSTNSDTDIRSGQFVSIESVAYKGWRGFSTGLNLYAIEQTTDDEGPGVPSHGNRMRLFGAGLSVAWRMQEVNCEVKLNRDFGGRNTREGTSFILRAATAF
jgi:hypothetical protein